ncbi:MAG: phosphatase PAP2 family protein [Nanoarchaeota archaeon]
MRNNKLIFFILIALVLLVVCFYFDAEIIRKISSIRNSILDELFIGITFVSSEIIIFFFLTSLFLWSEYKRKWILPLWVTLGLSVIISFILKVSIHRLRPFQQGIVSLLPIFTNHNFISWNFSFPSFQAMLAFCAVPVLYKEFPRLKYAWILFAGLVAFSRVYFGLHFMSDVIAGSIIGYLIGVIVIMAEKKSKFGEKIYKKLVSKTN